MKVHEVMTPLAITIQDDASVLQAANLMEQHHIGGLPVLNKAGQLVGMVSNSDFLHRTELGTEVKRSGWSSFLAGAEGHALDYLRSHGRKVAEIMTADPVTVAETDELDDAIKKMEKRQLRRLPVVKDGKVIGMISRANLVQSLASIIRGAPQLALSDTEIRKQVIQEVGKISWVFERFVNVTVKDGVVDLWGTYTAFNQDNAAVAAAENVPGVKSVNNHLVFVDPLGGIAIAGPGV